MLDALLTVREPAPIPDGIAERLDELLAARVAGPALRLACHEHIRAQGYPEPTGTATLTPGYHLSARFVAHTVGPVVGADAPLERDAGLLASCYRSILDACHGRGLSTVGFCAISTGVFGYPKRDAAVVALATIRDWLTGHPGTTVRPIVSAFTETDLVIYREALAEVDR